jgi:hypothetical protein
VDVSHHADELEICRMSADTVAAIVSAFVATATLFVGLFVVWINRRESTLRRGEVLAWANEVICALEGLLLVCILDDSRLNAAVAKSKLTEVIFSTATLVERGRMFFKNEVVDDFGQEKEAAYRGYRPLILDHIVIAHQIACGWGDADEDTRLRMRLVAEDSLKKFVSLAQAEVGRGETASAGAAKGGDGIRLVSQLGAVDQQRVNRLRRALPHARR